MMGKGDDSPRVDRHCRSTGQLPPTIDFSRKETGSQRSIQPKTEPKFDTNSYSSSIHIADTTLGLQFSSQSVVQTSTSSSFFDSGSYEGDGTLDLGLCGTYNAKQL